MGWHITDSNQQLLLFLCSINIYLFVSFIFFSTLTALFFFSPLPFTCVFSFKSSHFKNNPHVTNTRLVYEWLFAVLLLCSCKRVSHMACCCLLKVMPSMANSRKPTSKAPPSSRATPPSSSTQGSRATPHSSRVMVSCLLWNRGTFLSCRRQYRLSLCTFLFICWILIPPW